MKALYQFKTLTYTGTIVIYNRSFSLYVTGGGHKHIARVVYASDSIADRATAMELLLPELPSSNVQIEVVRGLTAYEELKGKYEL